MPRLLASLALLIMIAGPDCSLRAQDARGSIGGRVTDTLDALIVGAKVVTANQETGVIATAITNESGAFRLPFLLPGRYRISVEMNGFRTYAQSGVELRVGDSLDLPIRLEVGNVSETIEVKGGTPLLETGSSSLGQVMDSKRLEDLPQRGGNPLELERLAPGVANLTSLRVMKLSSPAATSQITVNGTGQFSTQFNMDGVSNSSNDQGRGYARVNFIPPSSAVSEFKMQSNPYDATVGHVFGAVINVSSKGGTNEFHGTLYYWAKNSAFDAVNFFDNKVGNGKIGYRDHRYGATVGGPLTIPHVYNGHNKTFFLYSWEGSKFGQPATTNQTSTVPTAAERTGDFSALLKLGSNYQIYNPFTTRPASTPGRYQRDPFPGNIIPASLLSTVGKNLVALYPLPNQAGLVDGRNNYYYPDVRFQSYRSDMARFDQAFSQNHRMFLRVNKYHFDNPKDLLGIPATKEIFAQDNKGLALDDVLVLSPTWILNIRYGLVNAAFPERRVTQGTDLAAFGFSTSLTKLADPKTATIPRALVTGFATLSDWADGDGVNSSLTHNLVTDMTKIKGAHVIRFGADMRLFRTFGNRFPGSLSPDFSFASTYTKGSLDNATAAPLGQELAAMLLGIPGGNMTSSASYAAQNKYSGFYVHDDYKFSSKLSLNLGLRYEKEWNPNERFDRLVAGYDFRASSPVEAQAKINYAKNPIPELSAAAFAAKGGLTFVDANNRTPYASNNGHFLPRAGLAYQLTPKTVFRGGYGIYFDTLGVDRLIPIQSGFSQSTPIQASLDNGQTFVATAANPLPAGLLSPRGAAGGLSTNLGQAISYTDPNIRQPYSQRWSLGVQRSLPGEFLIDASYVANRSTHLAVTKNINATPAQYLSTSPIRDQKTIDFLSLSFPNPFFGLNTVYPGMITRANLLRPYPQFGDITVQKDDGYAWYHSLQVKTEKRFSKGYTFVLAYTFSKYMQATEYLNPSDPLPYRGLSDFDRPQILTLSGVYELPFGHGRRFGATMAKPLNAVLGGWQLNGTAVRQFGQPLGFGNALFNGNVAGIALPKGQRNAVRWFNTEAGFDRNTKNQLDSNIRTFPLRFGGVRADGQSTWNFSLAKTFTIYERLKAQLRAETYNAMNHPSFANPNLSPTNSAFGAVTQTNSEPRNWQFALRINF